MSGEISAVYEQNVWVSIVVIIDESTTGPHGFRQPLLPESTVVMSKPKTSLRSDISERDGLRIAKRKRAASEKDTK
jgi:hypothetical protein